MTFSSRAGGNNLLFSPAPRPPPPHFINSEIDGDLFNSISHSLITTTTTKLGDFPSSTTLLIDSNNNVTASSSSSSVIVDDLVVKIVKGTILSLVIAMVIFGNLLVIAAVAVSRRLRKTITYFFVLSLAVADLLLGVIVLPFMMITIVVNQQRWLFGPTVCNLVTCADITLCTASILNLFLTTSERYIAIVSPFRYNRVVTRKNVTISVAIVWFISASCSFVPLHLGWNTTDGQVQNTRPGDDRFSCKFEFNPVYNVTLSVTTFFIPLILLAFANVRILKIAHSQRETIAKQKPQTNGANNKLAINNNTNNTNSLTHRNYLRRFRHLHGQQTSSNSNISPPNSVFQKTASATTFPSLPSAISRDDMPNDPLLTTNNSNNFAHNSTVTDDECSTTLNNNSEVDSCNKISKPNNVLDPERISLSRSFRHAIIQRTSSMFDPAANAANAIKNFTAEHKATLTILTIVGFFVACWLPYFILFTVKPFIDAAVWQEFNKRNPNFEAVLVWLGYINSLCNPIIYTCLNRHFRIAFARLLRLSRRGSAALSSNS